MIIKTFFVLISYINTVWFVVHGAVIEANIQYVLAFDFSVASV